MVQNQPVKYFKTICQMADLSSEETQSQWLLVWEKTIQNFLTWLIKSANLDQEELKNLEKTFQKIINQQTPRKNIINLVTPVLKEAHQSEAIKKFSQFFVDNLNNFYTNLIKNLKHDQSQVVKAYIKLKDKHG